jgi:hypothetical protein
MRAYLHQIFYDEASRAQLEPGYLPLDNTANLRPDWFEFWVIRNYLHAHALEEDAWYGFLSPRFRAKTGVDAPTLHEFVRRADPRADVALVPIAWEQLAYFQNPFEQGELWHPGITAGCQALCDELKLGIDLRRTVAGTANFTFCNYLIARPLYWRAWLALADRVFERCESAPAGLAALAAPTSYNGPTRPMKVFMQERLPLLVMLRQPLRTITFDVSGSCALTNPRLRGLLQACDALKNRYLGSGERRYFEAYRAVRELMPPPREWARTAGGT